MTNENGQVDLLSITARCLLVPMVVIDHNKSFNTRFQAQSASLDKL